MLEKKVPIRDAPRTASKYSLFLVYQNRRLDKGRFAQLDIGQGSSAVPGCTLSLQRKMIATSAKSIYEKAEHIVTSDSGGRIASHRGGTIPANVG